MVTTSIRRALVACAVAAVVAGCSSGTAASPTVRVENDHPSDETVRSTMDQLAAATVAKDWATFCAIAGSDCSWDLDDAAKASAPSELPIILGTADVAGGTENGVTVQGGRLIRVCGIDGNGQSYSSSVFFYYWPAGTLHVQSPTFWIGPGFIDISASSEPNPTPDPHCPKSA